MPASTVRVVRAGEDGGAVSFALTPSAHRAALDLRGSHQALAQPRLWDDDGEDHDGEQLDTGNGRSAQAAPS